MPPSPSGARGNWAILMPSPIRPGAFSFSPSLLRIDPIRARNISISTIRSTWLRSAWLHAGAMISGSRARIVASERGALPPDRSSLELFGNGEGGIGRRVESAFFAMAAHGLPLSEVERSTFLPGLAGEDGWRPRGGRIHSTTNPADARDIQGVGCSVRPCRDAGVLASR